MNWIITMSFLFGYLVGLPVIAFGRCIASASYVATVKIIKCEEKQPGEIFMEGELLNVSRTDKGAAEFGPHPVKGKRFVFYRGLSPLIPDGSGGWQERNIGYCRDKTERPILKQVTLTHPCCDANYPYCKRHIDFLIDEAHMPTF